MITVTRLHQAGGQLIVNADLIELVEETPDTVITLLGGRKLLVQERADEVVRRVIEFRRACGSLPRHPSAEPLPTERAA